MSSTFVPNFALFDPPSPSYSSTLSDSLPSMSPHTPSHSSPNSNVDDYSVFDASGDFSNLGSSRQGQNHSNLNVSSGWSTEEKSVTGLSSHGQSQPQLQSYHYLQQETQPQQQQQQFPNYINQQYPQNVLFNQHHLQSFQTGNQAQEEAQLQLALAQPTKPEGSARKSSVSTGTKKGASQRKSRRGEDGAQKRAIHNATERARRETLNGRFVDLAAAIPATSAVRRPSKPLIVKSALSFVEEALRVESTYRQQINGLTSENDRLLHLLNEERKKMGMKEIKSNLNQDFIMPPSLSEMRLEDQTNQDGNEVGIENEIGSENGFEGSQDDFGSSNQSVGSKSESGSQSYQHYGFHSTSSSSSNNIISNSNFDGFSMPDFFGQSGNSNQSNLSLSPFSAPTESFNNNLHQQQIQTPTEMVFLTSSTDGRRHSVSGFIPDYPQNY